jgi:hypothetical protein
MKTMDKWRLREWLATACLVACLPAGQAMAALAVGDLAPDFSLPAALGGKAFRFSLSDALKRGPAVVYFYPKSFTRGCTIEAHEFAEAAASFSEAGRASSGCPPIRSRRSFNSRRRNAGTSFLSPRIRPWRSSERSIPCGRPAQTQPVPWPTGFPT